MQAGQQGALATVTTRVRAGVRSRRGRWVCVVSVALPVVLIAAGCGSAESSPTSIRVVKGSVTRMVSASGTLQAITEQKLGFPKGGKLVELLAAVGQQVNAGQPLARLDDFEAQTDLQEASARLAKEQAVLDKLQDDNSTDATQDDYERAKAILEATKNESAEIERAHSEAIEQLRRQLREDRTKLRQARTQAEKDQRKCNRSATGNSHRYDGYGDSADVTTWGERGLLLENPLNMHAPACEKAERGKAAVASYQRRIESGQRELAEAQRRRDIDRARQKVAEENANREATAAGHAADGAELDRPHEIDEQAALVAAAEADVRRAERELADTTLIAPVSGRVAAINGVVGEYVEGISGTTPLAPGGRAALPDMESGSGSGDDDQPTRPGGTAFMVLKDVNSFQVVVPFEEADASLIQPNQKVEVTFDAIPGLTRAGTVAAVAPTGTQIKGVTNYYVTVVLNETDPRLKGGQTAQANVIVGSVDNVLVVPTAAVQRGGQTGVVQVLQPDGTVRQVQVRLGMVGDNTVEVVSGLAEGQRVVIPES